MVSLSRGLYSAQLLPSRTSRIQLAPDRDLKTFSSIGIWEKVVSLLNPSFTFSGGCAVSFKTYVE